MQVAPIEGTESFAVRGRGVLHLSVLIETMRREGYELSIGKPTVLLRKEQGKTLEPFESLVVEVPHDYLGAVMELTGQRRAELKTMTTRGDFTHVTFSIPARGLIGLRTRVLNATKGTAIMHHRFEDYRPQQGGACPAAATACWSPWCPERRSPTPCSACRNGPSYLCLQVTRFTKE